MPVRRISTGIEQLSTTDELADAVLTYATVLAQVGTADSVTIPIVREDGTVDEARLLLGPASQLTIVPGSGPDTDLPTATAVIDDLLLRTQRLRPAPIPTEGGHAVLAALDDVDE